MLDSYGWHDLRPVANFASEFDDDEAVSGRARPKKYRYKWSGQTNDEVLARLLAINLERAALQRPSQTFEFGNAKRDEVTRRGIADEEPALFRGGSVSTAVTSAGVRSKLVNTLKLDLVGPEARLGDLAEELPQSPSRWYLTGLLAPLDSPPEQRSDAEADDDLDLAGEPGSDDDSEPEPSAAAKQKYLPSSTGELNDGSRETGLIRALKYL